MNPNLTILSERYDWLRLLANTKRAVDKDTAEEDREISALAWALNILGAVAAINDNSSI